MKSVIIRSQIIAGLLIHLSSSPAMSATERRIDLVIGNGAYKSAPLRNSVKKPLLFLMAVLMTLVITACVTTSIVPSQQNRSYANSIVDYENVIQHNEINQILGKTRFPSRSSKDVSLGSGWVIVDMGKGEEIIDGDGDDFRIYEADQNYDQPHRADLYKVYVSNDLSNWRDLGYGRGIKSFDLAKANLQEARYVKIIGYTEGISASTPGPDIEAIEAINMKQEAKPPEEGTKPLAQADLTSPLIILESPDFEKGVAVVNSHTEIITGALKDDSKITFLKINDTDVSVTESGYFNHLVKLEEGLNHYKITASDIYGNKRTKFCIIKYERKPTKKEILSHKTAPTDRQKLKKDTSPPKIVITSHDLSRGINITKKTAGSVRGKATDESGVVEVRVNDKEAKVDENGNFSSDIFLAVGKNKIVINAMDRYENRSTKQFYIVRKDTPVASTPTKIQPSKTLKGWYNKQYAIVIGIDKYRNVNIDKLQNAVNDAKAVGIMFSKLGFEAIELYDVKATKRQIIKAFSSVIKKIQKNDSFAFYFAGHGQGFTLESGERVGYIIPSDADVSLAQKDIIEYDTEAIPLNTIKKYCKDMKAKHIALIFDSCFSGLAMKRSLPQAFKSDSEYYNDLLSRKSINVLTAGDDHPVSDGTGHSPFTRALLNGIDRKGLDIHDRDGYATFSQLAVYVKEKVEKATGRRQRPQFDNLSMEDGDFIFKIR